MKKVLFCLAISTPCLSAPIEKVERIEVVGAPIKGIEGEGPGSGYKPPATGGAAGSKVSKAVKNAGNKHKAQQAKKKSQKNKSWWETIANRLAKKLNIVASAMGTRSSGQSITKPDGTIITDFDNYCIAVALNQKNPCAQTEIKKTQEEGVYELRISQLTVSTNAKTGKHTLVYSSDNTLYFEGTIDELEYIMYEIVDL